MTKIKLINFGKESSNNWKNGEYAENGTVYYEIVSKVEYKEEVVPAEKPKGNKLVDGIQVGLDLLGLVPGIGEIADGLNGAIYTARGDKLNASFSFAAMIPIAGWGSTGAKFANKGNQLYQSRNVLSNEKVTSIVTPTYQEVVNGSLGRTQANINMFKTDIHNMTPKSVNFNSPLTVGSKGKDNASVTKKSNLYRGESLLHSPTRPNGIGKPHISNSGDLVPASKDGLYKGRQVTVTEHILGGYRKHIFAERFSSVKPYERRTTRLQDFLRQLAFSMSSKQAERVTGSYLPSISHDTFSRIIRKTDIPTSVPNAIGLDDFAFRKGRIYGSLMIYTHINLLRSYQEVVERWLKMHPEIQLVTRDGANAYREAITNANEKIQQGGDRWHLLKKCKRIAREMVRTTHTLPDRMASDRGGKTRNQGSECTYR